MPIDPDISRAPFALDANALHDHSEAAVITRLDGGYVAAWVDGSDDVDGEGGSDIFVALSGAGAAPGAAFLANTGFADGDQHSVALAAAADGGFYLGYVDEGASGADSHLILQRHGADGALIASTTLRSSSLDVSFSDLSLAHDPHDGGLIAAWRRVEDGLASIRFVAMEEDFTLQPGFTAEGKTGGSGTTALEEPMALREADGVFRFAYLQPFFGDDGAFVSRTDAEGDNVVRAYTSTHLDGLGAETPRIALLADGGIAASWITVEHGEGRLGSLIYLADGRTWSFETALEGHDLRAADGVGLADGGAYFVVWDATDGVMRGLRRDGLYHTSGSELVELFSVSGTVDEIDLAVNADGLIEVVWSGSDGAFAATLDPRLGGEDWVWASSVHYDGATPPVQVYEGNGTFTIRNDVADADHLSLFLLTTQMAGFDTLAFAPWPHSPADFTTYGDAQVSLELHYLHFDQTGVSPDAGLAGAFAGPLTLDLSALGEGVDLSLQIFGEEGFGGIVHSHDQLDLTGLSVINPHGGDVEAYVAVHEGATVRGADILTTFNVLGRDADIVGGADFDIFVLADTDEVVTGPEIYFGALSLDGGAGTMDTLLIERNGVSGHFNLRDASFANIEALFLEARGEMRVQLDVDALDGIQEIGWNDSSYSGAQGIIELHASGDADMAALNAFIYGDPVFELHGSRLAQTLRVDAGFAPVFAGDGDDVVEIAPEPAAAAVGFVQAILAPTTQFVDGGTGYDAVTLERGIADFSVARGATGFTVYAHDLALELENVETVRFSDGELFLEPEGLLQLSPLSPQRYDPAQDKGFSVVYEGTNAIKLGGNDWAAVEVNKTITPDTVVAFTADFFNFPEISGFGFDNDEALSLDTFFTLYGTDAPIGLTDFAGAAGGRGPVTYEIPVGAFFTGAFRYMTFANDHDAFRGVPIDPLTSSEFADIRFFEREALMLDGQATRLSSWGSDSFASAQVGAGGEGITFGARSISAADLSGTMTRGDWMRFTVAGEVREWESALDAGFRTRIMFDDDLNDASVLAAFDLAPQTAAEGEREYMVHVGAAFTGAFEQLVFANPHGAAADVTITDLSFVGPAEEGIVLNGRAAAVTDYSDHSGGAVMTAAGDGLRLFDDGWLDIGPSRRVEAGTWLAFDLEADSGVYDIGLRTGGSRTIDLYGSRLDVVTPDLDQYWGYRFHYSDGQARMFVNIGAGYSGSFSRLYVDVAASGGAAVEISNIVFHDNMLMVDGRPAELVSYVPGQDHYAARVLDDGTGFTLLGNAWKAMEINAVIEADTWLVFDLEASDFGEVTAIGFDDDLNLGFDVAFQLGGIHSYGIQNYRTHEAGEGKVRVEIHLGAFFQGEYRYLTALADDDADVSANVTFSNIDLIERTTLEISGVARDVVSYGGTQDHGVAEVDESRARVMLGSNAWKAAVVDAEISWETWLIFDFYSDLPVEVAGIGFDDDLSPSQAGFFQIAGSETYGNQDFHSYETGDGWVHYAIHVGRMMEAGTYKYLTLLADDDASPVGRAYFDNIEITDVALPVAAVNGAPAPILSYGLGQDHGQATPAADLSSVTLSQNAWKAIERPTEIDAGTWLSVTFEALAEAEVFAIGFDTDLGPSSGSVWQLSGIHAFGRQEHNDIAVGEGPVHKMIHVGGALAGSFQHIALIADDDDEAAGIGRFSEIEILQEATGVYAGYGGPATGLVQELDGASGVRLSQNANRLYAASVEVDANTVLHFEFKSHEEGEIHGIGLETDDSISGGLFWQLMGTQTAGRQGHNGLYSAGDGWVAYEIAVGAEIAAGTYDSLSLLMDSDGAGTPGDSWFRNVRFENAGAADEDVLIF